MKAIVEARTPKRPSARDGSGRMSAGSCHSVTPVLSVSAPVWVARLKVQAKAKPDLSSGAWRPANA